MLSPGAWLALAGPGGPGGPAPWAGWAPALAVELEEARPGLLAWATRARRSWLALASSRARA